MRLIGYGDLPAEKLESSNYWKIPLTSVLAFEEERERGRELAVPIEATLDTALEALPELILDALTR